MGEKTFEESLRLLEEAVERLESGDLSLEESLRCFESGIKSASDCRRRLKSVQVKVERLVKDREQDLATRDEEI